MARAAEKHEARRLKKQRRLTEVEEPGGPDATDMPTEEQDQQSEAGMSEEAEDRAETGAEAVGD